MTRLEAATALGRYTEPLAVLSRLQAAGHRSVPAELHAPLTRIGIEARSDQSIDTVIDSIWTAAARIAASIEAR